MDNKMRIFIAFIVIITIIVLGYAGAALYKVYQYNRLSAETNAENVSFSVKPHNDEKFFLHSSYYYKVNGKDYPGETTFTTAYRNPYAAEEAMKEISKNYKTVWYDPSDPSFSSMDRSFPMKLVVYASILFAIWNYFIWGGYYYTKSLLKR